MIILDNKKLTACKSCNKKEVTFNMFIFNNLLYCFKCSMEKLKNNFKIYLLNEKNNVTINYITK